MSVNSLKSHTAFVTLDVQRAGVAYTGGNPAFLKRLSDTSLNEPFLAAQCLHAITHPADCGAPA